MSKHTPGPWVESPHGLIRGGVFFELHGGSAQEQVAMACVTSPGNGEQEANSRLIAAAPELLDAARELLNFAAGMYPTWLEAMNCDLSEQAVGCLVAGGMNDFEKRRAVQRARAAIAKAEGTEVTA